MLPIIDGVVLSQEWVAEDEQWPLRWWNIDGHQTQSAAIWMMSHIIFRAQTQA